MFSKFLRRISVAVIGVIFLLGAFSGMSLCAKAQSPGTGELEVFQIEQVRAEMPQIQVYIGFNYFGILSSCQKTS